MTNVNKLQVKVDKKEEAVEEVGFWDNLAKKWKIALKFLVGLAILFLLLRTMGYTVKDAAVEGKTEVVTYWTSLWALLQSSFKQALKQVIMNVHQTFVILIAAWLFSFIKNIWKASQGKIFSLLDVVLGNYSKKKRSLIKEDIEKIVDANITLIESAFRNNVLPSEDAEEAMVKSQQKLSSVLTLTIHDIMKKRLDRDLEEDYSRQEVIDMLVLEVEKGLLRKKADKEDIAFGVGFNTQASDTNGAQKTKTSGNVMLVVDAVSKKLPKEYKDRIAENQNIIDISK